jgi:hypothetical protein
MANKYYYLVASLPYLRIGGESRISKKSFLYECGKWLTPGDMEYLLSADMRGEEAEREKHQMLEELIEIDYDLRKELARIRDAIKKEETPRVPDMLKPVMDAENPLSMELELAKLRWRFLEDRAAENFFDINWLVLYFIKVQMLERLDTFDKEKGETFFYGMCEVHYEESVR